MIRAGSDILIENILAIAESHPDRVFAKLLFATKGESSLTYKLIIENGKRFARAYEARGIKEGDVVAIILNHGPELVFSFVGALLLGAVPSIFACPSPKISAELYFKTLSLILQVCKTPYVLTHAELAKTLAAHPSTADIPLKILVDRDCMAGPSDFSGNASRNPADIVLLQHSSGTTGLKKGVALSNQSIVNQLRHYSDAIKLNPKDKIVSWLPLYHDMGLIAGFILPMMSGVPLILMSPFEWVADPATLFEAISRERGTLCWLPNFSYNLLAANVMDDRMESLSLKSMRAFINCSEPVSAESHDLFYSRFKKMGLSRKMLSACYAMAENTFAVTQGSPMKELKVDRVDAKTFALKHTAVPTSNSNTPARRFVSSGTLLKKNSIRIVDDKGSDLADRHAGEIIIRSDSMLTEYYHRSDLTQEALKEGWYFTGDIGYIANKHLFVTGRKKDLIIVAGKNIYPQDIDAVVSSTKGIYPGRVSCFGLYDAESGTEQVIVLAESKIEDPAELGKIKIEIAKAIREQLECVANDVAILPHMWLIKSSSGKISRAANKEKYLKTIRSV